VIPSPHCKVCQFFRVKDLNLLLLRGRPASKVAKASGLHYAAVLNHMRHHLPYRPPGFRKAVTPTEMLEDLSFELSRLQALAENGEAIGGAVTALNARRAVVELQTRMQGGLQGSHKAMLAAPEAGEEFEVSFSGGRAVTKAVEP
jgi:hypothetical protein